MKRLILIHREVLITKSIALGCIWIKDLVWEKETEMETLKDPTVPNGWILKLFHFHFIFPHQILDPNTALGFHPGLRMLPDVGCGLHHIRGLKGRTCSPSYNACNMWFARCTVFSAIRNLDYVKSNKMVFSHNQFS